MSSVSFRVRKLLLRLVAVLVVAVGIPVIIAGPASAHHPEITASVDCTGTVSFTATSWVTSVPAQKTNPNIGVYLKQANGSFAKVTQGAFAAPNYSFSGTFSIGSAATATIRVKADAAWGSGVGPGDYRDITVTAPTNCGTTTISNDCTTATVDLVNTGAAPKTYKVTMTGKTTQTKTVAGNSSDKVVFTGLEEDATYTINVIVGVTTVDTKTFTVDCTKPTATLKTDCTQYVVTLNNSTSSKPTDFVVTVNGKATSHTVGAKQTKPVSVPVVEAATYVISVTYAGGTLLQNSSTVDCEKPTATITPTCTGYVIVLDNTASTATSRFTVKIGTVSTNYDVLKGDVKKIEKTDAAEGSSFVISVKHGTTELDAKSFTIDCQKPAAVITSTCTGYSVNLNNSASDVAVTFTVTVNNVATDYTVPAHQSQKVEKTDAAEGASFNITVKHGSTELATKTFTIDCEKPAATVVNDCTSWTANLDNTKSDVAVTFTVSVNGKATSYLVPKGENKPVTGQVAEGSTNTVVVTYGTSELATKTFTIDCEKATATISHTCTTWTAALDNSQSTVDVEFVVTVNGASTTHKVEAGKTKDVTGDVVDDQATTITVEVDKRTLKTDTFTEDCAQPAATITSSCTGYSVYLDNLSSKVAVDFVVTINGKDTTHTVLAGADKWIVEQAAEGDSFTITVTDGAKELAKAHFTIDCEKPAATVVNDCTTYTATLDNSASSVPVKFTVTVNGDSTDYTVPAKGTLPVSGPVVEDSSYTVVVTSGSHELAKDHFTVNCQQPEATVANTCTGYTVSLDNSKSIAPVTFTVKVNGVSTDHVVPAKGTDEVTGSVTEGSSYTIVVSHGQTELATSTFDIDCEKPAATIADSCTGYTVHLDNRLSSVEVTFTVTVNGVSTDHKVPARTEQTISENAAEGDAFTITVSNGHDQLATSSFTVDCEKPQAEVSNSCTAYTAKLINTDSLVPVTFTVTVNGVSTDEEVLAGETEVVTGPVAEDSTNTVSVSQGSTVLATSTFDVDCQQPAATITSSCTDYTVNLDNSHSTVPVDFTVTVNGVDTPYTLQGGETKSIVTPAFEGSTYDVEVTSGATLLAAQVITIDCAKPVATVANSCTSYTVTLDNTASTIAVEFTVTIDGAVSKETVPAGETKTLTGPVAENSSHIISVANGTESLAGATFTVDCVKPTALVAQSCAGYDVTLDNTASTIPVEFTVTVNGVVKLVTVANGQVQHVTGVVAEDSTNTITVNGGGAQLVSSTFTQNCETSAPAAAVTHDCTSYTATLNNTGSNIPVEFTVNVNGVSQAVTVAAGQTQNVTGPVVEDGTYTVTVSAGGAQLVTGSFIVDCVVAGGGGGGGNGGGDNGDNGDNNNGGGGGGAGGTGTDTPTTSGALPATGTPALLGLALLMGLALVTGGGLLVAGDRRRIRAN